MGMNYRENEFLKTNKLCNAVCYTFNYHTLMIMAKIIPHKCKQQELHNMQKHNHNQQLHFDSMVGNQQQPSPLAGLWMALSFLYFFLI